MNRILQRAVALLLIPLTAFSIIINSYGTAYAAAVLPVTYGMGEESRHEQNIKFYNE